MKIGEFETNNIYNLDCYEAIKKLPDKSVDLIIIDPPYDIRHTKGGGMLEEKRIDLVSNNITNSFDFSLLSELDRVMKARNIYIWCNKLLIPQLFKYYIQPSNKTMFDIITWHKTNAMPLCGSKYLSDTEYCLYFHETIKLNTKYETAATHYEIPINIIDKNRFEHPTIKPLRVIENLIYNSSNNGDVVLDCFLGSGTTAVACKNTGRQYIGFEINEKWYKIAENRLNNRQANGQMTLFTM